MIGNEKPVSIDVLTALMWLLNTEYMTEESYYLIDIYKDSLLIISQI